MSPAAGAVKLTGTATLTCSACGVISDHALVQSVNEREDPGAKAQLLQGELNLATCACGKRTLMATTLLFHDPDASFLCQVCPDGEAAMVRAEAAFAAAYDGVTEPRVQRLVPSQNALVEKLKIHEAGLHDWAVEMSKVLLLASLEVDDDDRVLLFSQLDREAGALRWLLFDAAGEQASEMSSLVAAYQRLIATAGGGPPPSARRIDRSWAIEAVRAMISSGN
jgi:CpXC protein